MNEIVIVSGNIGSGKTTLIEMLSQKMGWKPHYEFVNNNPYLPQFYEDMKRWAFNLEIFFLTCRVKQYQKMMQEDGVCLADRVVYEGRYVFTENLLRCGVLSETDFKTYLDLYEALIENLRNPTLVVYLKTKTETSVTRILQRGREWEQNISINYLKQLNLLYREYVEKIADLCPVVTIEADNMDVISNQQQLDEIAGTIQDHLQPRLDIRYRA
ncbi:MAG: deoxynucleoside kinase [Elusimicrobiota bacterium]